LPKSELSPQPAAVTPKPPAKPRVRKPVTDKAANETINIIAEPLPSDPIPASKLHCYAKFSSRSRRLPTDNTANETISIVAEPLPSDPIPASKLRCYAKFGSRSRRHSINCDTPSTRGQLEAANLPVAELIPSIIEALECNMELKRIVEAILFAANRPMTVKQIQQVFPEIEQPDSLDIQLAIDAIIEEHKTRPVELKKLASGYRFQVKLELSRWVSRLFEEKPPKYSRALLETLSIIAYRQPVTRGEIEDIRGVSVSSSIIQTLLEREWVRVIAHKEVPGRPGLYGTTKQFLDYFNIESLTELPTLQEIQNLDLAADNSQLHKQVDSEQQQTRQQATEESIEDTKINAATAETNQEQAGLS